MVLSYDYLAQLLAALSLCEAQLTITTIFISYIVIFYSVLIPLTLPQITQMVRPLMMRRSLISETAGAVNTETDTNSAGVAIIDQRENQKCNSQVRHLTRRQQNNTRLIRKSFILHTTGSAVDKFPT